MTLPIAEWIKANPWIDRVIFQTDAAALVEQTHEPKKPRYFMSYRTDEKFRFIPFRENNSSNFYMVLSAMFHDNATVQSIYDAVKAFQEL